MAGRILNSNVALPRINDTSDTIMMSGEGVGWRRRGESSRRVEYILLN